MFTRILEVTAKSGKAKELSNTINDKVLATLKKQVGFVDETVLVSVTEPNRGLAISFWNTKEDAERYRQEQYPAIHECLSSTQTPWFGPSTSRPQRRTRSQPPMLPETTLNVHQGRAQARLARPCVLLRLDFDLTPETNSDLRLRALKATSLDLVRSVRTLSL